MRDLWPSYFGYALSFATIGIMWINHHAMFRDIERADHTLLVMNLLLLLSISFVPFPTAVLAEYMRDDENARAAMLAYGGTFTINALLFNATWFWAARGRRFIDEHVSNARLRSRTIRYLPGAPMYAFGLILAFINTWAALAWWTGATIIYLLPPPE